MLNYIWDLTFDPRAKPPVVNIADCGCMQL